MEGIGLYGLGEGLENDLLPKVKPKVKPRVTGHSYGPPESRYSNSCPRTSHFVLLNLHNADTLKWSKTNQNFCIIINKFI